MLEKWPNLRPTSKRVREKFCLAKTRKRAIKNIATTLHIPKHKVGSIGCRTMATPSGRDGSITSDQKQETQEKSASIGS